MRRLFFVSSLSLLLVPLARGQEAPAPGGGEQPAPLVLAQPVGPRIEFQVGADLFHGLGLGGAEFVGGFNAALLYPLASDRLRVGIRPALHYLLPEDAKHDYESVWMHADVALQVNLLQEPVRLYLLGAGGYAFAQDNNIDGLAHGGSGLLALGVAWKGAGQAGLFAEVGFRYGGASSDSTRLVLDEAGRPIYDEATLTWQRESFSREFELMALTVNLGVTISP